MKQEMTIDLREVGSLIKKWWWIPTLLALGFAVIASIYTNFIATKMYESNTSVYLVSNDTNNNRVTISELQIGTALISDYAQLVKQRGVANEVIDDLKLNKVLSPAALSSMISVTTKNDTRVMKISVADIDPNRAAVLVDKVAEVFSKKAIQTMNTDVQILDKAEVSLIPTSPNVRLTMTIAVFVGIMLGFLVIFLIAYFDNTIKTPKDIKKLLELDTMSTIPVYEEIAKKEFLTKMATKKAGLITIDEPKSVISEQYRVLRTSLEFKGMNKNFKKILVTSTDAHEGKTSTALNLAVVLAQVGKKVLVIDADLRNPDVHKYLGLSRDKGLCEILQKADSQMSYIQKIKNIGIDVITAGGIAKDPAELLCSSVMKSFLESIVNLYDYVIIDSPPLGYVTDAVVLSSFSDAVILVVESGTTKSESAKEAKEELSSANANILGVVINKMKKTAKKNHFKYYGIQE